MEYSCLDFRNENFRNTSFFILHLSQDDIAMSVKSHDHRITSHRLFENRYRISTEVQKKTKADSQPTGSGLNEKANDLRW